VVFRSKIDLWLLIVLIAAAVIPLTQAMAALQHGSSWIPHVLIFVLLGGGFLWLLFSTKYTVDKDTLAIQSGPFRWRIPKNDITRIAPSRSLISSPALSLDRLRIDYAGGQNSILVSPKDKIGFLKAVATTPNAA
jgi:hypothetical protein